MNQRAAENRQEKMTMQGAILLAAGGTGGHMFPASALAQSLKQHGFTPHLATDQRGLAYVNGLEAMPVYRVPAATIYGSGRLRLPKRVLILFWALLRSFFIIRRVKPHVIVGFGGYPSFGPVMMGLLLRIPVLVHEQNAVLGRANRIAVTWGAHLAASFAHTKGLPPKMKSAPSVTGNPLRQDVLDVARRAYQPPSKTGQFCLLVFGGSQGAHIFAETLPAALALMPKPLRARLNVVHQVSTKDMKQTLAAYHQLGVPVELRDFFDDLPSRMRQAHLTICRGGASTISELMALGAPAVIVPLPGALDQDQAHNAGLLVGNGGAWMMQQETFNAETLAAKLQDVLNDVTVLGTMSAKALSLATPDAARKLAGLTIKTSSTFPSQAEERVS